MTVHITVPLDDEQNAQLEALAHQQSRTPADLVASVIRDLLAKDAAWIAALEEGLDDVRAGRVYDYDEVKSDLRAYVNQRMKQVAD